MTEINELLSTTYTLKAGNAVMLQHCVAVFHAEAEGQVANPAGEGAGNIAGVLRDTMLAAGRAGIFQVAGIAKVKIAEAVMIGDTLIVADSQGRVRPKGAGDGGAGIVGRAVSSASTAGSIVKCILCIPGEFSS